MYTVSRKTRPLAHFQIAVTILFQHQHTTLHSASNKYVSMCIFKVHNVSQWPNLRQQVLLSVDYIGFFVPQFADIGPGLLGAI